MELKLKHKIYVRDLYAFVIGPFIIELLNKKAETERGPFELHVNVKSLWTNKAVCRVESYTFTVDSV